MYEFNKRSYKSSKFGPGNRQMFARPAKRDYMSNLSKLMYASRRPVNLKRCLHVVREHLNSREMHLTIIKSMLNQALRENAAIGH